MTSPPSHSATLPPAPLDSGSDKSKLLHHQMMDPSVVPRYLQERQHYTGSANEEDFPPFSLSSYPWRLEKTPDPNQSSTLAHRKNEQPHNNNNNNNNNNGDTHFVHVDYLELRRRQNQKWADEQLQLGLQKQAQLDFDGAQQAFEQGLELVPHHTGLEQALQEQEQPKTLRRSGLATKSERSRQDAVLEQSLGRPQHGVLSSYGDSKYPFVQEEEHDSSTSSSSSEVERRRQRRRRKSKKRKQQGKKRKTQRHKHDYSSDDDQSSEVSRHRKHRKRHHKKRKRRRERSSSPDESTSERKFDVDADGNSDRRPKRKKKKSKSERKRKRRKREDDSPSSTKSGSTVDSLKLIHLHAHHEQEPTRDDTNGDT